MRYVAVFVTHGLALAWLFLDAVDLAVGAPWRFPALGFLTAAVFAALSVWIRRTTPGRKSPDA